MPDGRGVAAWTKNTPGNREPFAVTVPHPAATHRDREPFLQYEIEKHQIPACA